jgi:hypothetical protein
MVYIKAISKNFSVRTDRNIVNQDITSGHDSSTGFLSYQKRDNQMIAMKADIGPLIDVSFKYKNHNFSC